MRFILAKGCVETEAMVVPPAHHFFQQKEHENADQRGHAHCGHRAVALYCIRNQMDEGVAQEYAHRQSDQVRHHRSQPFRLHPQHEQAAEGDQADRESRTQGVNSRDPVTGNRHDQGASSYVDGTVC
jgi:hypothetical protein